MAVEQLRPRLVVGGGDELLDVGPPPSPDADAHTAWNRASTHIARSRTWLATHHNQPLLPVARTRSITEPQQRLAQLETHLATAPPDHRRLIDQLTAGQLTIHDLTQALDKALAAQDERRRWILRNWPHIVEHTEITRTLTTHTDGPHLEPLLDQLALVDLGDPADDHTDLAAVARTNQPWLHVALSELVPPDLNHVSPSVIELLDAVADYRKRWHITHPRPLGLAATTNEQAHELADLTRRIDNALALSDDLSAFIDQETSPAVGPSVADLGP